MATSTTPTTAFVFLLSLSLGYLSFCRGLLSIDPKCDPDLILGTDNERIQFALNLEYLEAEFFLWSSLGKGLDALYPNLTLGGPPPIGAQKANLDPLVLRIIQEFGYQEAGHLRSIIGHEGGFPRPLLNISRENFASFFDKAVGFRLNPPFDVYANSLNYMLAVYSIPYVGLVGYVGTIPYLLSMASRRAGQDAVTRAYLYARASEKVSPYNLTVADFAKAVSTVRNNLGKCGIKDEGIIVSRELGAENQTSSNVLSADRNSLSYARIPSEILRIAYASGNESVPGGFYPRGANGRIARSFLPSSS